MRFYVEKILDHKVENNETLFLVKWLDYGEELNSWEPSSSFDDPSILDAYWKTR